MSNFDQRLQAADFEDELDTYVTAAKEDPTFRAAYEDVEARHSVLDELVRLRRIRRLSQSAVAARMGVRQPTVSQFETEDSDPRLSTLQRYARAVEARLRLFVLIPNSCDWISAGTSTYCRSNPLGSAGASVHEGELAEAWCAEKQRSYDRWSAVSA